MRATVSLKKEIQLKKTNIPVDYDATVVVVAEVDLFYLIFILVFAFSHVKIIP